MPLFTITMRSGRTVTAKDAISAAIHEASVSAGYPDDDHFQRFISLEEADLRISPLYPDLQKPRSEHVLMIEVLVSSGTAEDRKRSLLSAIVTRLQAAGTDPKTSWSSSARSTVPVVPLVAAVPPCLSRCCPKHSLPQRSFEHRGEHPAYTRFGGLDTARPRAPRRRPQVVNRSPDFAESYPHEFPPTSDQPCLARKETTAIIRR